MAITTATPPTFIRSLFSRISGAAAPWRATFASGLPADRDRERLLADLRALRDSPADVESCLRR